MFSDCSPVFLRSANSLKRKITRTCLRRMEIEPTRNPSLMLSRWVNMDGLGAQLNLLILISFSRRETKNAFLIETLPLKIEVRLETVL